MKVLPCLKLRAFVDLVRCPWRTYYEKMPPVRDDIWSQIDFRLKSGLRTTLRLCTTSKDKNKTVCDGKSKNEVRQQTNIRIQTDWDITKKLRIRGRFETVHVSYPSIALKDKGWLAFSDCRVTPAGGFRIESRIALYETDSYDSRVYEFENDLPGMMTNAALFGKGLRWFMIAKLSPVNNVLISGKYSATLAMDEGNNDYRIGLQIDLKRGK